jgi:hypothetical protein
MQTIEFTFKTITNLSKFVVFFTIGSQVTFM